MLTACVCWNRTWSATPSRRQPYHQQCVLHADLKTTTWQGGHDSADVDGVFYALTTTTHSRHTLVCISRPPTLHNFGTSCVLQPPSSPAAAQAAVTAVTAAVTAVTAVAAATAAATALPLYLQSGLRQHVCVCSTTATSAPAGRLCGCYCRWVGGCVGWQ